MKYFIIFMLFICLLLENSFDCKSQSETKIVSKKVYKIHKSWRKVFGEKFLDQHLVGILPLDDNFNFLCNNAYKYRVSILNIIGDNIVDKESKFIALYTLQYQCIIFYKEDLRVLYSFFDEGKISEELLMSALWQDDFSLEVVKNVNSNVELKDLIIENAKNPKISLQNREFLGEILSPTFYKNHKIQLDEIGEVPFECNMK